MSKKRKDNENEDVSESYKVFGTYSNSDEPNETANGKVQKDFKPYKSETNFKTNAFNLQGSDLSVLRKFDKRLEKKSDKKNDRKLNEKLKTNEEHNKTKPIAKDEEKVKTIIEHTIDENRLKPDLQDNKQIQSIMDEIIEETKLRPEIETNKKNKSIKPIIEYLVDGKKVSPEIETDKEDKHIKSIMDELIDQNKSKPEKGDNKSKKLDEKSDKDIDKKLSKKSNSKFKSERTNKKDKPKSKKNKMKTIVEGMIKDNKLKPEIETNKEDRHVNKKIIEHMIDENKLKPEIETNKEDRHVNKKIIEKMVDENKLKPELEAEKDKKDSRPIMNEMKGDKKTKEQDKKSDDNKIKPEIEVKKKEENIRKIVQNMIDENKLKPEIEKDKNDKQGKSVISEMVIDKKKEDKKFNDNKSKPNIDSDKKDIKKIIEDMIKDNKLKPEIETNKEDRHVNKKIIEHMIDENKLKPEKETDKSEKPIKQIIDEVIDDKKTKEQDQKLKSEKRLKLDEVKKVKSDQKIRKKNAEKSNKDKPGIVIVIDSGNNKKNVNKKTVDKKESTELHLKSLTIPPIAKSSDEGFKSSKNPPKLSDDFPYSKNMSSSFDFDLSNKTDEIINLPTKLEPTNKQPIDPLERIKHKLEEQVYLKQEKPSDFEMNSQKRRNSLQQSFRYNKMSNKDDKPEQFTGQKEQIKRSKSLSYLEQTVDGQMLDEPLPAIKIKNDMKEINIKSGQNMKANFSLGSEIKAQVEDRDSHLKVSKGTPNDEDQNDWSSISIQLDITKDPKTRKIEINEDVKVIPKKDDEEAKNRPLLEDSKKTQKNTFYEPNELIPYVLDQNPSITHYIDKNESVEIKKDDKIPKFDRFYTPSGTEIATENQNEKTDDPKLLTQQNIGNINQKEQDKSNTEIPEEQGVVLFKADKRKKIGSSKESIKTLKRMDKFDSSDKRQTKGPYDSSSDEQTYEQVINKRNETLKLHFPTFSPSPPAFQPTPPPFHLKLNKSSTDSIKFNTAKSEELTYYEQKKKFDLVKDESSDDKHPDTVNESETLLKKTPAKSVRKQSVDYENIKRLDIPSEKVAEIDDQNEDKVKINKKEAEIIDQRIGIKLSDESKQLISIQNENLKDSLKELERGDDQVIINKFDNETERLRRLERYLIKVKSILNNEDSDLNVKKSLLKRLILIKKDLNKLGQLCDNLIDRKFINKILPPKRIDNGKATTTSKEDYSDNSSDEDEKIKIPTFRMIREELNKKSLENKKPNFEDKDQPADDEDNSDLYENSNKPKVRKLKDRKQDDKSDERDDKRDDKKQRNKTKDKNFINDKKQKLNKMKNNLIKLLKKLSSSNIFRLFLCFIIFCTFMFTYCHFNQSKLHKKFPCKLKRKV